MVWHVPIPGAETFCYPGAQVPHINSLLPNTLQKYPAASTILTHIGSNNLKLENSEGPKNDFKILTDTVLTAGKQCVVSGLLPSPRFGDVKFSCAHQLHVWIKGYCLLMGIPFVDNFHFFWNRLNFFACDGLHLNRKGKQLPASNMLITIQCAASIATPSANSARHD